jgi:hypothetical protein
VKVSRSRKFKILVFFLIVIGLLTFSIIKIIEWRKRAKRKILKKKNSFKKNIFLKKYIKYEIYLISYK